MSLRKKKNIYSKLFCTKIFSVLGALKVSASYGPMPHLPTLKMYAVISHGQGNSPSPLCLFKYTRLPWLPSQHASSGSCLRSALLALQFYQASTQIRGKLHSGPNVLSSGDCWFLQHLLGQGGALT